ncbi:hypothetical protein ACQKM2_08380 [Streptomyces sp. NPDC004126]|uniref:hypothetical protein n=1 Tax=Streptomyces sp. NPDC004126 TaxID=3390695 RepID=UPI003CFCD0C0
MTTPGRFEELMAEATAATGRFGHREHVHLTWLAVRRHGAAATVDLVGEGILRTATRAGVPGKFHATLTRLWVELVGHRAAQPGPAGREPAQDFEEFAALFPELLDKELPKRFYSSELLGSEQARTAWTEPDLAPLPWRAGA